MNTKKVWLVTGASKGLGLALVKRLLNEGYKTAATSRDVENLKKQIGEHPGFLPLAVQLVDEQSVQCAVAKTIEAFGTIDVVVNNAGYGQGGTLEELSDAEARKNFDVNVFGPLNVIRSVMPHFRQKKSGHIINIASIGGLTGAFPAFGVYCATKFAMVGFTESLSEEIAEFNVKATVVYPGYFRTNFLNTDSLKLAEKPIANYTASRNSETWHQNEMKGRQPGSPEKAALVFIQLAESKNPPVHLIMGSDAFRLAHGKIELLQKELVNNEALSKSTDF